MTTEAWRGLARGMVLVALGPLVGAVVLLVVNLVVSRPSEDADPHGYAAFATVFFLFLLLVPFLLLAYAARDLSRHKRAGFGWGTAAGMSLALFASPFGHLISTLVVVFGIALSVVGIVGLRVTRRGPQVSRGYRP